MQAQHSGSPINDSLGVPCKSDEDTMRGWSEHYEAALNHPRSPPDASIPVDAPSPDEVECTIWRLRNGRAVEADDILPELLKCAIDPVSRVLHGLFCTV